VKYCQTAVLILATLFASVALAEDFRTVNGKEYKDATISRVEADGLVLKIKSGISKVYFVELAKEVQERFHYNVQTPSAQDAPFEVELKEGFPSGRFLVCNVTFNGTVPPPETVDKIVHDSLQSAAQSHPTREILAMGWHGDDALTENQYSGD
jgi:hypothetical protein